MKPPVIILQSPQMGENIGSAARAMQNFGLSQLRIVAPRDGWPNPAAEATAAGAFERMETVQVYDSLGEAIADLHFVFATTARRRDMVKPAYTPASAAQESVKRACNAERIGFLFGRERTGLENEEIALCQAMIHIPTHPDFASLNLGQAVLLIAYEWMKFADAAEENALPLMETKSERATQEQLEGMLGRLLDGLESGGFFKSVEMKPSMQRNIRNIFSRIDWTEQEVRTFHGVLSALSASSPDKP